MKTLPFVIILVVTSLIFNNTYLSTYGVLLALLSGGITSGIGYAIWCRALAGLSATQAAVLQLSVPAIAILGGLIFISEAISYRVSISAIMILGGVLMVVLGRYYSEKN